MSSKLLLFKCPTYSVLTLFFFIWKLTLNPNVLNKTGSSINQERNTISIPFECVQFCALMGKNVRIYAIT